MHGIFAPTAKVVRTPKTHKYILSKSMFSVTSGATTPIKLRSTRKTSGSKGDLDRLSSCKVDHIGCVDTEENQQDLC